VLPAIGFDDQPVLHASEVSNELAAELAACEASGTEQISEQPLCIGHVAPQAARHPVRHTAIPAWKVEEKLDASHPLPALRVDLSR
jgi:anti-sigma factor RsiW